MVTPRGAPLLLLRLEQGGGGWARETPFLRFWMYQRLASDWIWTHRYIFIRATAATGHFVHQDSWKCHPNMNHLVDKRSCQRFLFRVMLEHLLNGMACSYTLWEGSRGQNVVVLFAFCKGLIRDNTVLWQKSNPQKIHFFVWQQKAIPIEINWIDLTMSALFGPVFSVWRAYTEVNFGQDSFRYVQIRPFFRKKCWYSLCIWRFLCYFGDI